MIMPLVGSLIRKFLSSESMKDLTVDSESSTDPKIDMSSFKTITVGGTPQLLLPSSRTRLRASLLLSSGSVKVGYDESLPSWKSIRLPRDRLLEVDSDSEIWAAAFDGGTAVIGVVQHYY